MGWQNGTFRRLFSWTADANAGFDILADRMDSDTNDIVGGINNTLTRDGQNAPIGNLPMAGFKHLSVAQASNPTDYARFDQVLPATGGGTISGSLTVTGAAALHGGATVTGGLTADQLTVSGPLTVSGAAALHGGATVTGGLTADQLTVTGGINANGGINTASLGVSGPLTATGAAALNGGATIAGLTVNGNSNLSGDLGVGGTLTAPTINCTNNRLVCEGTNAPSVTMYNTTALAEAASGFWVGAGGLNIGQMNGDGTPVTAWAYFDASGNFTLNHTLNLGGSVVQIGGAGTGPGGGRVLYLP